jgi:hypothetical protein
MRWLREHGAHGKLSPTGTYVTAKMPTAVAAPASLRGAVRSVEAVGTKPGFFHKNVEGFKASGLGKEPGLGGSSALLNTGTPEGCEAGREFHYPVDRATKARAKASPWSRSTASVART